MKSYLQEHFEELKLPQDSELMCKEANRIWRLMNEQQKEYYQMVYDTAEQSQISEEEQSCSHESQYEDSEPSQSAS